MQSGQTGTVEYGQIEHFVTDLKTITVNEQKICAPIQTPYFLGSHVNVKATDLKVNNSVSVEVAGRLHATRWSGSARTDNEFDPPN